MNKDPITKASSTALPKVCGADIELGNFIAGVEQIGGTGYEASRALLAELRGLPRQNGYYGSLSPSVYAGDAKEINFPGADRLGETAWLQCAGHWPPFFRDQWRLCLH